MKYKFYFTLLFCFSLIYFTKAQNFQHIEDLTDLNILEYNNGVAVADYDNDFDL